MVFEILKKITSVQKEISLMELFLKGFPVLPDNWCQRSKAKSHPEPWGLMGFGGKNAFQFFLIIIHFVNSSFFLISKLLININRPCQKGAIWELSEELPMHINQWLIYNSYIQLLLKFGRERGQGKASSTHLNPNTNVTGNSRLIMCLAAAPSQSQASNKRMQ